MSRTYRHRLALTAAVVLLTLPAVALAHDGESLPNNAFVAGISHPVLGLDHLLAMLCVGIVSAQIGGRAMWTVPATFVAVMAVGGLLGVIEIGLSAVELGIALSVVVLGVAIAADSKIPIVVAMIAVGFFAIFHGYAHGSEMPDTTQPLLYAIGFLTGTAVIHIAGVFIGDIASHYERGGLVLRLGGVGIAVIGVMFIVGVL